MYWYRLLSPEPVRIGPTTLNPRQVFAFSYEDDKLYIHQEDGKKTFCRDIDGMRLLQLSRALTNKQTIPNATIEDIKKASLDANRNSKSTVKTANAPTESIELFVGKPRLSLSSPSIPKSFPIKIGLPKEPEVIKFGGSLVPLMPITGQLLEIVEKSLSYLGTRVAPKATRFNLYESKNSSTCFLSKGSASGIDNNYLIIQRFQLAELNDGLIDVALMARVITHELAHYMWHSGVVKQSDLERFRKQLAARRLHPNQFEHAGYGYPWYEEAWAILAEYMVHGKSARRLSTSEGYEIVAKYFDNNFLKGGKPSGEAVDTRFV